MTGGIHMRWRGGGNAQKAQKPLFDRKRQEA
jgi:hypothetical protein